ncbi:uncharacterized protein LOC141607269 [Silene latifolia]|uniref:uncharacterized protein LOC141607269 n=1 Tax=Silene latifolia TaxID=37657 RepID=UPI003D781A34
MLNIVKGAQSFKDIRTVDDVVHPTFKSACNALGLLDGDDEWHTALTEAATWSTARQLRELFVTILLFCEVSDPNTIWSAHWEKLSDDILPRQRRRMGVEDLTLSEEQIKNYALLDIEQILNRSGRSLKEYAEFPLPDHTLLQYSTNRLILEEQDYDELALQLQVENLRSKLNTEQRVVYETVLDAVHQKRGGVYFVYHSGGTGKTYLWKTLISRLRGEGHIVLAVASSGISALLLISGRTAHSRFAIPLNLTDSQSDGNILATAKEGEDERTWISIPEDILIENKGDPVKSIVEEVYPQLLDIYKDPIYLQGRAILAPKNETTDDVNHYMLDLLPGDAVVSKSVDRIYPLTRSAENMENLYPPEFLNSLKFQGLPNHEIHLKVGCPIILLRNINQTAGMCNGTRLTVTNIQTRIIEAKIITGTKIVSIPRIKMTPTETKWPFTMKRRQFPVKVQSLHLGLPKLLYDMKEKGRYEILVNKPGFISYNY